MKANTTVAQTSGASIQVREQSAENRVTAGHPPDRAMVLKLLNEALATEIVCVLRYRRHHFMARGIQAKKTADTYLAHSNEEQEHADQIAERITQLGGEPDFAPESLTSRSHAQYSAGGSLAEMSKEDLVAEHIAIDSYRKLIQYLGDQDPATSRLLGDILAVEEKHADTSWNNCWRLVNAAGRPLARQLLSQDA